FKNGVSMSRWRVVTKSGACSTGCTLDKAEIQKVAHNKIWSYKDKAYKLLEGNEIIEPWVGFWMAGYKEANGLEPTLIIPID
ncbi:MAG: hypothetical protein KAG86_11030, partial [Gammaproteobacteria bacterium]|nr:hypothetical protein [Gammaproteobacteria bacterium]